MLFDKITPELAGIESKRVRKYIEYLEKRKIPLHSLAIMKGNDIFCECYWAPYTKDSLHRMYSQTKSYVSIAIGMLIDDGKISLNDKIADYFEDKIHTPLDECLKNQTIRDMLTMCTVGGCPSWFASKVQNRAEIYFNAQRELVHPSGLYWQYDSSGSQVLSTLVERITGMPIFDFLYERIFTHLGTFKTATILKARGGDSWGDSALLCTTRDMLSFARLLMNEGNWQGKQLVSSEYVREATAKQVNNCREQRASAFHHGYGYQIWRTEQNGFAFVGMGNQLTVCLPEKDLIFTCTADCQGDDGLAREYIINAFFDMVVDDISPSPIEENNEECARLEDCCKSLTLFSLNETPSSTILDKINGKRYVCEPNPMGIIEIGVEINGDKGMLRYTNAQGDKELVFGINHNEFSLFPQLGYSNDVGGVKTSDGFKYKCATSGAWLSDRDLLIYTQIIDRYLGNLRILFTFKDKILSVKMEKTAEDFLNEYEGVLIARQK